MTLVDTVKEDLTAAMRAGEKDRVGALRLVLCELQKAAKEGDGDELAVLRRERKRRLEAAAAFRDGGRDELADGEEAEAKIIEAYLPAEMHDDGCARSSRGDRRDRRGVAEGHGPGDEGRDGEDRTAAPTASASRRSSGRSSPVRRQIELSNDVAAELAGSGDTVLRALEGHVDCDIFLRGNVVTLDGEPRPSTRPRRGPRAREPHRAGPRHRPGTIAAVTGALDQHRSPAEILEDVVWRHRSKQVAPKTVNQKRYVDSIRDNTITFGIGPAGTGKTFLAVALAAAALSRREVNRIILTRPAVEAGERLGFLPGDLMAKIDPYLRPLFDALHDMLDAEKVAAYLERGQIEVAPLAFMRAGRLTTASSSSTRRRTRRPSR